MIFLHPSIDPILFSLGIIQIRWYGLAYVIGILLGFYLIKFINRRLDFTLNNKLIDNFFIWSIAGIIIGGRVGYVLFYQFDTFLINPIYIIYIWQGGMSFHGGLLGIIISTYFFAKKNNFNFFILSDLISIVAPIGIFFGRIANFINKELIGRVTDFPIAIIYPTLDQQPRHLSQLYEALFEGIILFFILIYFAYKNYPDNKFGQLSGIFLLSYGFFRFFLEFLREPDQHLGLFFNFISMGQLLSIPLILFGLFILSKKNGR
tara:strand:- start:6631 stop:7416 length:786 start_codon:yes stop_codon:yes gene_type:complete